MRNFQRNSVVYMLLLSLVFFGCRKEEGASTGSAGESSSGQESITEPGKEVSFSYSLPSWIQSGSTSQEKFTADDILRGTLTAEKIDQPTNTKFFDWTVYLKRNEDGTFSTQSNQTINLVPGDYKFSLTVSTDDGNYEYTTGSVYQQISLADEEQAPVSLTIHPVIGGTIVIDGDVTGQTLQIDKTLGETETFVSLAEGTHTVRVEFYEGNTQIGKMEETGIDFLIANGTEYFPLEE